MQFVNFVFRDGSDDQVMHTAPVPDEDAAYLQRIIAQLRPLSEEDYMNGPAAILRTLAKSSYVLDGAELFWCIEWDPGLIVVRFSPNGAIAWAAIRSPVPNFGGREAADADWDNYNEDAADPQYNLVLFSWDAQFDAQEREWRSFVPAPPDVQLRFEKALRHADELRDIMERRFSHDPDWFKRCEQNLKEWCGDGVHLN